MDEKWHAALLGPRRTLLSPRVFTVVPGNIYHSVARILATLIMKAISTQPGLPTLSALLSKLGTL